MSGRQEKGQHAYWCNIGNQQNNNQSPQQPSANKAGDKKNNDKTTTDKACHGSKNQAQIVLAVFSLAKRIESSTGFQIINLVLLD